MANNTTKLFEVRDAGTTMVLLAMKVLPTTDKEKRMLSRCGYETPENYIFIGNPNGDSFKMSYDPFQQYGVSVTLFTAERYIHKHWDELASGDVICTEFIRGERPFPKEEEI